MPTGVHLVLAATNVLAISAASLNASLTFITIPRLLELPAPLNARRWRSMFDVTKWWVAGPMLLSGLSYLGLAYTVRQQQHNVFASKLLATAGVLCVSIVPYTRRVVLPTIRKLWAKVERFADLPDLRRANEDDDPETAHALIHQWGTWNLGRALPVMAAALIGQYAMHLV